MESNQKSGFFTWVGRCFFISFSLIFFTLGLIQKSFATISTADCATAKNYVKDPNNGLIFDPNNPNSTGPIVDTWVDAALCQDAAYNCCTPASAAKPGIGNDFCNNDLPVCIKGTNNQNLCVELKENCAAYYNPQFPAQGMCAESKCKLYPVSKTLSLTLCAIQATSGNCSDGDPCTQGDKCGPSKTIGNIPADIYSYALCQPGSQMTCDDTKPCTDDACTVDTNGKAVCTHTDNNSNSCGTNNACQGYQCLNGKCIISQVGCPSNQCAHTICDPGQGCIDDPSFTPPANCCQDDTGCPADTDCKDFSCDKTTHTCTSTNLDGKKLTPWDQCIHTECQGGAKVTKNIPDPDPTGHKVCEKRVCDSTNGWTTVADSSKNGTSCEDGDFCTVGDQCQNGKCQPGANQPAACAVLNACDKPECDEANDQCLHHSKTNCCQKDADCTPTDKCHEGICDTGTGVCSFNPLVGKTCNDQDACTQSDKCDANGKCSGTDVSANCDQGNPCKKYWCDPLTACKEENKPDGYACTDNKACTGTTAKPDHCENAVCIPGDNPCDPHAQCMQFIGCEEDTTSPNGYSCDYKVASTPNCCSNNSACNDFNDCTKDECLNHVCQNTQLPDSTTCNDNNNCTGNDVCKAGNCVGTSLAGPVNGNPCLEKVCQNSNLVDISHDGNFCDPNKKCHAGECSHGVCMDKGYSAILCPPPPPTGGGETSKGPDTTDIKLPSGDLNQEAAIPTKDIVLQGSGRLLSCGSSLLPEAFYETSYKLGALIVFLPLILFGLRRKR